MSKKPDARLTWDWEEPAFLSALITSARRIATADTG
jgi:hypothetical protein